MGPLGPLPLSWRGERVEQVSAHPLGLDMTLIQVAYTRDGKHMALTEWPEDGEDVLVLSLRCPDGRTSTLAIDFGEPVVCLCAEGRKSALTALVCRRDAPLPPAAVTLEAESS